MRPQAELISVCIFAICVVASSGAFLSVQRQRDPDETKNFGEICAENGFQYERHQVITDDYYILSLFRIPGTVGAERPNEKVAFLQHGLLDSADTWIMNWPNASLAFRLVENGYDVWMGNSRGNKYSHANVYLDPKIDKEQFFNYSYADMGMKDLPAEISYVLKETGADALSYVGHSQGTSQMFYGLVHNFDFFKKRVKSFAALAPIVRMRDVESGILDVLSDTPAAYSIAHSLGIYEWFPSEYEVKPFNTLCDKVVGLCLAKEKLIEDEDPLLNDLVRVKVSNHHFPSGSSMKTIEYYGQLIQNKTFREYDYGAQGNLVAYGQEWPPLLDLSVIQDFPIGQFVGVADELSTIPDNAWLREQLGNNAKFYSEYNIGHEGFIIGKDTSFIKDTIDFLNRYQD